jgi:hypothetical protein
VWPDGTVPDGEALVWTHARFNFDLSRAVSAQAGNRFRRFTAVVLCSPLAGLPAMADPQTGLSLPVKLMP